MRVWDINPGYLNRQSLLGEHRELHGLVSILVHNKQGYSRHPETLRWVGFGWALKQRHKLLAAEMALRGFTDQSPVATRSNKYQWPKTYIDEPRQQFRILQDKYTDKEAGRIPLPKTAQQLWRQHKYSVLARNHKLYKKLGTEVATMQPGADFTALARLLSEEIRKPPLAGGLRNAVQHMWGYVADCAGPASDDIESWSLARLLKETQRRACENNERYLIESTALGELAAWLPNRQPSNR
jgi:hypothetical protein